MKSIETEKVQILMMALEERYSSIRIIRDRVQTVSLRILGILFACAGYIFQAKICLCCFEKILLLIVLWIVYYILYYFYFDDLKKGFMNQRKIAGEIEKKLGFYTKGHFEEKTTLYPKTRLTGDEGNFFKNNNILVILGFAILTLSIILYT